MNNLPRRTNAVRLISAGLSRIPLTNAIDRPHDVRQEFVRHRIPFRAAEAKVFGILLSLGTSHYANRIFDVAGHCLFGFLIRKRAEVVFHHSDIGVVSAIFKTSATGWLTKANVARGFQFAGVRQRVEDGHHTPIGGDHV